jgi:RNA polymerase subunit RPABC4/transcription elongation factor Spt4
MQQRSDNPILPYVAAAGIILFTPIFFVFAYWIYKLVRPHEKIGETWERNLAEEALLAEVESIHHCPTCERRIDDEWIICPTCRTRLKRVCPNCSRLVGMDWSLCAWCGKDFERREVPAAAAVDALPRGRDATDRISASSTAAASTATAPPSSVRSSGSARSTTGPTIPAAAQDPLPER